MDIVEGRLEGPGATWLVAEARGAQFVFLGENHGLADQEHLTRAVWLALHPVGSRHLAVEEGPWSA